MDFDRVINNRQSVRDFKKKKASWKDVLKAVDTAIQGPFSGNLNNLRFIIVENNKTIKDIASYCEQEWISNVSILIVVCSDDNDLENLYGERGRVYSRQQAGAAINTLILKLADLGIDSCWVGAYSDDAIRDKLGIPKTRQIEAVIPVGYASKKIEKKKKSELENVLRWENWNQERRPTIFEEEPEDYRPEF